MYILLSRFGRLFVGSLIVIAVTSFVGFDTLTGVLVASKQSTAAGCSVSPTTVALDQSFTVSASGLPTNNVNLIITYPNATASTSPISVSANGTYTLTMSSAGSMFPSEQTGLYKYQFVGKIKWPQGTFNQSYATCSENVT